MPKTRVVILGGGFGGLVVARRLSRSPIARQLDIVIVDAGAKHVYAPWLYELATSCLTDASNGEEWREAKRSLDFTFSNLKGYTHVRFRQA
ncbi:MAG: FAD-dependent oxidoreductase, partial [Candidatus Uhrbacteria bacterium]|nr:FAD-dependent oxidoreductase [Candidatus Uhrbacteria bacterium]